MAIPAAAATGACPCPCLCLCLCLCLRQCLCLSVSASVSASVSLSVCRETRIMKDEFLAYGGGDVVSAFTLAMMEDLGHYIGDYSRVLPESCASSSYCFCLSVCLSVCPLCWSVSLCLVLSVCLSARVLVLHRFWREQVGQMSWGRGQGCSFVYWRCGSRVDDYDTRTGVSISTNAQCHAAHSYGATTGLSPLLPPSFLSLLPPSLSLTACVNVCV